MTYPGRLNFNDPNRDWPGDTIRADGTVRTPLWQIGEELGPDQYEVVQEKDDPKKRAKWGTLFFARAREGSRFYDRMAGWPIAFEEALIEMCRRNLPASEGWAIHSTGQSTGGPFAHILLQRVENVVGLAGLETSQWGSIGATTEQWGFPFNYLTIRTWRHIAKYLGPESGPEGHWRLPWVMEDVLEQWDRVKTQPQFKAEYFVSFGDLPALAEAARATAKRLGLSEAETGALVVRYHNLTRPLQAPNVPPVPPLLYQIAQGSVDHNVERYKGVLFANLDKLPQPPKKRLVLLEAGVHANETPEQGLPQGIFPVGAYMWNEAIRNGYFE
jgi:hypothetical protein